MRPPQLIAHRGYTRHYPENTLAGIEAAIRRGARSVEVDVQLSADGMPVLFHDRNLERVCAVAGAVHDKYYAEIVTLPAHEPARFGDRFRAETVAPLTGLGDLLARHPEVTAFVEAKRIALAHFGCRTVLDAILRALRPVVNRCVLISFATDFLELARRHTAIPIGVVVDRWEEKDYPAVRALEPDYLFCDVDGLPASGPLAAVPARVAVYEIDDGPLALQLARRGADFIETFAVGELLDYFSTVAAPSHAGRTP